MAPAMATYEPRDPSQTLLYQVVADHLETFLASLDTDLDVRGLPAYVEREFYDYLQCGVLAHGLLRLGCDTCHQALLLAFSCKRRGFCPSCAGRRMAQTAAPPTWSRRSSLGCPRANGSSRCLSPATASAEGRQFNGAPSPCATGWPRPRS
jgi:hypothetical protein